MRKAERAQIVSVRLDELYPNPSIPLDHRDEYTFLISVLLSAQCTDKMVNRVTPELWKLANNPRDMAKQSIADIQAIIKPCGLGPQKAKAIHGLSVILNEQYEGKVPRTLEELEKLPGVGHKTASVVMCQAFGVPAFPIDTHIHRLAQRWKLTNGKSVMQTENDLKKLFPQKHWCKLHLQIIYYGREYCSARGCDGTRCPICAELFPDRKTAIKTRK